MTGIMVNTVKNSKNGAKNAVPVPYFFQADLNTPDFLTVLFIYITQNTVPGYDHYAGIIPFEYVFLFCAQFYFFSICSRLRSSSLFISRTALSKLSRGSIPLMTTRFQALLMCRPV